MKKFLTYIGAATLLFGASFALMAYNRPHVGAKKFKTRVFTLASGVSQLLNDPIANKSAGITHYNEVCIKANDGSAADASYFSDTPPTLPGDEATTGWPIVGSEKECHDWSQGMPIYGWCNTAGNSCPMEIRITFVE